MKNLRSNSTPSLNNWGCLPPLDDMALNGFQSESSWSNNWLNLLADLIQEESHEAVDMLENLCKELEKDTKLRTQVLQHKTLMQQIMKRVLTHQDQYFVRLGLVALEISLRGQKVDLIKDVLRSYQMLAFIIALLNSESMFVLRRAVRLLSLVAEQCHIPWKLNDSQKHMLNKCMPRVQYLLLETNTWSATYATQAFVTKDMFRRIGLHPKS